jgi:surfactin synthase thioesterase subunit
MNIGIELYVLQLPGRGNRLNEQLTRKNEKGEIEYIHTVFQIVHCLRDAFKELGLMGEYKRNIRNEEIIYMKAPSVFFGHSLGAIIAFELCMLLEYKMSSEEFEATSEYDRYPPFKLSHFLVSSCPSPNVLTDNNFDRFCPKYFHASAHDLVDRYKELKFVSGSFQLRRDVTSVYIDVLRFDYEIYEHYMYHRDPKKIIVSIENPMGLPLSCPLTLLGARDDTTLEEDQIKGWHELSCMQYADWGYPQAVSQPAGVTLLLKEGRNFYMNDKEHENWLLRILRSICAVREIVQLKGFVSVNILFFPFFPSFVLFFSLHIYSSSQT